LCTSHCPCAATHSIFSLILSNFLPYNPCSSSLLLLLLPYTSSRGQQLIHCIRVAKAQTIIMSGRFVSAWESATDLMGSEERPTAFSLAGEPHAGSCVSPLDRQWLEGGVGSATELNRIRLSVPRPRGTPLFHIFTSGTTGLPKAANFSHERFAGAGITWAHAMRLNSSDVYYITLPLFHGNGGVVAVAAAFHSGATIVLREKFSVSNFWKDIRKYQVPPSEWTRTKIEDGYRSRRTKKKINPIATHLHALLVSAALRCA
jgi:acyl-CoA synthetase (AMP-forming)/AMP-acid ligase II